MIFLHQIVYAAWMWLLMKLQTTILKIVDAVEELSPCIYKYSNNSTYY